MKILCVVPSYWPAFQFGGPIFSIHSLNKALAKKGIDVTVYTTFAGLHNREQVRGESNIDGVKVNYFSYVGLLDFMGNTGYQFSLSMSEALKNNLKLFDIIHMNAIWNYPIAAAYFYCRKYNKPYIISPRGSLEPYCIQKRLWKKIPYYWFVGRKILNNASAIHYSSEQERGKSLSYLKLKAKGFIVSNGIDLSDFNDLPSKEKFRLKYPHLYNKKVILFLGRINTQKGLDILLKAFQRVSREDDRAHMVIAGNDNGSGYEKEIKVIINSSNMRSRVTFMDLLSGNDKLETYRGSDIFVLPSYSESFGLSVLEAMACRIPVIISDKAGISKTIDTYEAGIVINPETDNLYMALKSLLNNEELRKKIAAEGRRIAEEYYDIDKIADKMIEEYEKILK